MPRTGRPLEVLHHGVEHQAGMLAHGLAGGQHQLGRDGIALLRHCRGGSAAGDEGLVDLGEFGRGHDHEVECDLAQRAGDEREEVDGFGQAVARHVPCRSRLGEAELGTECRLYVEALVAQRRQRAGGAGELADQHARLQLLEPFGMAIEHGEPDRDLVAEGDGQRVLQVRAARHRRVAVLSREARQDGAQGREILFHDAQALAQLEDHRGVHDVLGGGAPMDEAAGLAALLGELVDQRQDGIAHDIGLAAQMLVVEGSRVAQPGNLLRGGGRDDAAPRLRPGERHFDLDAARDEGRVGKDRAHPGRPEGIAEQDRVQHRRRTLKGGHRVCSRAKDRAIS